MKRTLITFIMLAILGPLAALSASGQGVSSQAGFGRSSLFNDGWLFSLDGKEDYSSPDINDARWKKVSLPHDWSVKGLPSPYLASCTGYLPGGIGWYRKHFSVNDPGRKHYIYFEGVYNRSSVWLNGHLLGNRPNGYVSFMYDITPYLKEGDNVLAVKVDHSRYADSRWYTGSGIYRNVWIVSAPETHLAQWGVTYRLASLDAKEAVVEVDYAIDGTPSKKDIVKVDFIDAAGNTVATGKTKASVSGTMTISVKNPHLWNLDDPYLYNLRVSLVNGKTVSDEFSVPAGLRTIRFDADKGFFLNGKSMKLKGICIHHDAGVLGSAVPRDVWARRMRILKEMGVNAIRMSHNPQAPDVYEICDETGLLVMDEGSDEWEFPKKKWVEGWNVGTPAYDGTYDFFEEWIETDIADIVRRDRNHPSVILWSVGNEVDYPNDPYSHPILNGSTINQPMYGGYNPEAPDAMRIGVIAKRLAKVIRANDTSRPVTGALAGVVMSNQTEYPQAVDVVGYNYTEDRYDIDHETYPDRIIYGSETRSDYGAWKAVTDREFISGQFIWTGIDYLGESHSWPSRGMGTGLLDFGGFRKAGGKFREALWGESPVTWAGTYPKPEGTRDFMRAGAPDLWNYEDGQIIRVVCYTNAPYARLMLNGRRAGELKPFDESTGIISWDVPYEAGTLVAQGCDKDGNVLSSDTLRTFGRPAKLSARLDDGGIESYGQGHVAHIIVEVTDEDGNICKLADNKIYCGLDKEAPAEILGLENSDNTDMNIGHEGNVCRAYNGRLLAYIKTTVEGTATVRFTSPLLEGTEITLNIK